MAVCYCSPSSSMLCSSVSKLQRHCNPNAEVGVELLCHKVAKSSLVATSPGYARGNHTHMTGSTGTLGSCHSHSSLLGRTCQGWGTTCLWSPLGSHRNGWYVLGGNPPDGSRGWGPSWIGEVVLGVIDSTAFSMAHSHSRTPRSGSPSWTHSFELCVVANHNSYQLAVLAHPAKQSVYDVGFIADQWVKPVRATCLWKAESYCIQARPAQSWLALTIVDWYAMSSGINSGLANMSCTLRVPSLPGPRSGAGTRTLAGAPPCLQSPLPIFTATLAGTAGRPSPTYTPCVTVFRPVLA